MLRQGIYLSAVELLSLNSLGFCFCCLWQEHPARPDSSIHPRHVPVEAKVLSYVMKVIKHPVSEVSHLLLIARLMAKLLEELTRHVPWIIKVPTRKTIRSDKGSIPVVEGEHFLPLGFAHYTDLFSGFLNLLLDYLLCMGSDTTSLVVLLTKDILARA